MSPNRFAALTTPMLELLRLRPYFGYRRVGQLLSAEGWRTSVGREFRLWRKKDLTKTTTILFGNECLR